MLMLNKEIRGRKREVTHTMKNGQRINGQFGYLKFSTSPTDTSLKLNVIVPKKIINKATDRNLTKRQIKQILLHQSTTAQKTTYIYYVQKNGNYQDYQQDLADIFTKLITKNLHLSQNDKTK